MKEEVLEELVLCQCNGIEHQMVFRTIEGDPDVFVVIHLRSLPFRKRVIHALKYLFGYRCRYGDFDEMILRPEDVSKFEKVVNYLKTNYNQIK